MFVAAPLVGAQAAHAQPPSPTCQAYPPVPPQLTLSRTVVPAGDTLTFRGSCFAPFERVVAELHSHEVVLGRFRANAQGVVRGKVTIPRKTEPGYHTFELEGRTSRLELSARIKVLRAKHEQGHSGHYGWSDGSNGSHSAGGQGAPGPHDSGGWGNSHHHSALAATGSDQAVAVGGIAAGLVAAGGAAIRAVRRRRTS
ncbi:hypothetical protein ABT040_06370 [Streptomyces sp. NPDC002688]|uniref:hypothetical protein n=1 Tax=Streptomyces sp. NPDC002688 TaxID=3154423 RepID=UPI00332749EE